MQAILCVFMLQGPQIAAKIRSRCSRLFSFENSKAVEAVLSILIDRYPPFVKKVAKGRWMHCLSGEPNSHAELSVSRASDDLAARVAALELVVAELQSKLDELTSE